MNETLTLLSLQGVIPFVLTSIVLTAIIIKIRRVKKESHYHKQPFPGIPIIPYRRNWFFGHLRVPFPGATQLKKQQVWCVDNADPSTGMCSFYMLSKPIVSVLKAEHAQKILMATTFKNNFNNRFIRRIIQRAFGVKNIVRLNGREWKIHRSYAARSLQTESALSIAQYHIWMVGKTLVNSILSCAEEEKKDQQCPTITLDFLPVSKMATMDVFGAAALGRDMGCCRALQPSVVANAFDYIGEDAIRRFRSLLSPTSHLYFIPTEANRRFKYENRILRNFLHEAIDSHMRRVNSNSEATIDGDWDLNRNLLSQMLAFNNRLDTSEDSRLNFDEIVDTLIVFLFAGYDTTANGLSFALHQIAANPKVQENCVAEARRVLGARECTDEKVSTKPKKIDVLACLPYCHAAFLEALRLFPPATSVPRTLEKPIVLDGITLPAGTTFRIPIHEIHRDERNFALPLKYLPERWVRPTPDGEWVERNPTDENDDVPGTPLPPAANRSAFLTFSSGARNCLGRRFALQEGTLLLAILLRDLKFELKPDYKLDPGHVGPILEPKGGLPMIISRRD